MYSIENRQLMAKICNDIFKNTDFKDIVGEVSPDDFSENDTNQLVWWATRNGILNGANRLIPIFSNLAKSRKDDVGQFFHFKPSVERIRQIIRDRQIQLTALSYQSENDFAEFAEFLKRSGYLKMFYDNTIDDYKKKVFILCFTKNSREKRFWSDYADNDNGACICFRYDYKPVFKKNLFDLRDVDYDTGYRFDFINDLRYKFVKHFGKELFIDGITKFAQFYKRNKYSWENETRLSFNYNLFSEELNSLFPINIQTDADGKVTREFIKLDLDNSLLTLNIDEIICGRNVTDDQMKDIKADLADPSIPVWRRP